MDSSAFPTVDDAIAQCTGLEETLCPRVDACMPKCQDCTDEASDAVTCYLETSYTNCPVDCTKDPILGTGAVAGIAVGGVVAVAILAALIYFLVRGRKNKY
jgi:hypothetical protein